MKCLVMGLVLSMLCGLAVAPPLMGGSVRYTYDDAGRLVSVDFENRKFRDYTYDNAGNLLSKTTGESLAGDVYPDLSVTLADAIIALQTASGMVPVQVSIRGEVDNDQRVGIPEAVYVLRKLALEN